MRELNQIKKTLPGSEQHLERIDTLVRLQKDRRYPIDIGNTLFVAGANGDKGDGLVDQSSAHLSNHSYTLARVGERAGGGEGYGLEVIESDRIPDLVVAPLPVMHFPEKIFWGLGGIR